MRSARRSASDHGRVDRHGSGARVHVGDRCGDGARADTGVIQRKRARDLEHVVGERGVERGGSFLPGRRASRQRGEDGSKRTKRE